MIPKRAIVAIIATGLALTMVLSFRTPDSARFAASPTGGVAIVGEPTTSAAPTATAGGDSTTTSASYVDGSVTGPVVSTRFGDVQVQVTVAAGVIVDVTALQLPSGDRHSERISSQVEPILREEALTAQSADIDLLSGATYTSRAYAQSLQAALDAARA